MSDIAENAAEVARSRGATGVDIAFVLGTGLGNMA